MALANCAAMGVGPEECGRLDLWTYQALLHNWNKSHNPGGHSEPGTITDIDSVRRFHRAHLH